MCVVILLTKISPLLFLFVGITDEFDEDDDILYGNDNKDEAMHHPFEVKDRAIPNPFSSSGVAAEKLTPAMKSAAMSHRMIGKPCF